MNKNIYLECVNAKSKKFYDIELEDKNLIIHYGRINCSGKELIKKFDSEDTAVKFFDKQLNNKLKKYSIATPRFKQLKFGF